MSVGARVHQALFAQSEEDKIRSICDPMRLFNTFTSAALIGTSFAFSSPALARCGTDHFNPTGTSNFCVPLKGSLFESCKAYAYAMVDRGAQITVKDFARTCVEANGGDYWYGSG